MTEPTLTEEDIDYFGHYDIVSDKMLKIKQQILQGQKLIQLMEEEQENTLVFGTSESVNQMHWKQEFIKKLLDKSKGDKDE